MSVQVRHSAALSSFTQNEHQLNGHYIMNPRKRLSIPQLPGFDGLSVTEIKSDLRDMQRKVSTSSTNATTTGDHSDSESVKSEDVLDSIYPVKPRRTLVIARPEGSKGRKGSKSGSNTSSDTYYMNYEDAKHGNGVDIDEALHYIKEVMDKNKQFKDAEIQREELEALCQSYDLAHENLKESFSQTKEQFESYVRIWQGLFARAIHQHCIYSRRNLMLYRFYRALREQREAESFLREELNSFRLKLEETSKVKKSIKTQKDNSKGTKECNRSGGNKKKSSNGSAIQNDNQSPAVDETIPILRIHVKDRGVDVVLYVRQVICTPFGEGVIEEIRPKSRIVQIQLSFGKLWTPIGRIIFWGSYPTELAISEADHTKKRKRTRSESEDNADSLKRSNRSVRSKYPYTAGSLPYHSISSLKYYHDTRVKHIFSLEQEREQQNIHQLLRAHSDKFENCYVDDVTNDDETSSDSDAAEPESSASVEDDKSIVNMENGVNDSTENTDDRETPAETVTADAIDASVSLPTAQKKTKEKNNLLNAKSAISSFPLQVALCDKPPRRVVKNKIKDVVSRDFVGNVGRLLPCAFSSIDSLPMRLKELFPVMQPIKSSDNVHTKNKNIDYLSRFGSESNDDKVNYDLSALNDFYREDPSSAQEGTTAAIAFDGDLRELRMSLEKIGKTMSDTVTEQQPLMQKIEFSRFEGVRKSVAAAALRLGMFTRRIAHRNHMADYGVHLPITSLASSNSGHGKARANVSVNHTVGTAAAPTATEDKNSVQVRVNSSNTATTNSVTEISTESTATADTSGEGRVSRSKKLKELSTNSTGASSSPANQRSSGRVEATRSSSRHNANSSPERNDDKPSPPKESENSSTGAERKRTREAMTRSAHAAQATEEAENKNGPNRRRRQGGTNNANGKNNKDDTESAIDEDEDEDDEPESENHGTNGSSGGSNKNSKSLNDKGNIKKRSAKRRRY